MNIKTNTMKKPEKVIEAIEYFYAQNFIEELTTDKRYYTEILIDFAAEKLNITDESKNKQSIRSIYWHDEPFE